jgi:nitroimidazol reductase NimA-like FMN-containing flavoprotein (pyridoxamine 5'-phosphate oxidase superfamily)
MDRGQGMKGAMSTPPPSERATVRRLPQRASYEWDTLTAILDEGLVAHVGFSVDGQPYVLPMVYARLGECLYLHGATSSRLMRQLEQGVPACLTVTLLDGLVLARSAFHHSVNYRSVVVLGTARRVVDEAERLRALEALTEHMLPGRWAQVRPPNAQELKATSVLALPLAEASAKVRTGPPRDDEEDLSLPVWAGELPLRLSPLHPVDSPDLRPGPTPEPQVIRYQRGTAR